MDGFAEFNGTRYLTAGIAGVGGIKVEVMLLH